MTRPHLTLAGRGEAEVRDRGSVFLAVAAPARAPEDPRELIAERERAHHDATHHCSAWRLHGGEWRANDAGEPSGSAGPPILAAIEGAGLEDCAVVVTRYYGGTKLGVGGLIRAYGEAAALALQAAPRCLAVPSLRLRIPYAYEHTAAVMRALERAGAGDLVHGYAVGGAMGELECTVPIASAEGLAETLREQTAGSVEPQRLGRRTEYRPVDAPARPA